MSKIVQIAELSVYGEEDEVLLENLSFNLDQGEIAHLPNLSDLQYETLFKVLTGDLSPDTGQVVLGDRNIVRLSRKNRKKMMRDEVSFLPSNFVLPKKKTIYESLEFKLDITNTFPEIPERINETLELIDLKAKADQLPQETSELDQVKTALAISIITSPGLLVCHKPFTGLNSKGIEEIINLLTRLKEQQGLSVLLLTDGLNGKYNGVDKIESGTDSRIVN